MITQKVLTGRREYVKIISKARESSEDLKQ